MDFSAGRMNIVVEEGAKRVADGRYLYCGGLTTGRQNVRQEKGSDIQGGWIRD
jgi:hypothetical protein